MDLETLLDRINLGEDQDIKFKSADGGFPNEVWKTVSAFANTDGGLQYGSLKVEQVVH